MKKKRSTARRRKPVSRNVQSVSEGRSNRSPGRRSITVQNAPKDQSAGSHSHEAQTFKMESKVTRVMFIMAGVFVFGVISIYFYVDILLKLRNFYTLFLVVPLYGYIFGDLLMWLWRGIRIVELNSSGFNITRRKTQSVTHIGLNEVGSVRVMQSIDGKTVNILLHGARSRKFLWMEFYSGPRIRIAESAFDKKEFLEFIDRANALLPTTH